MCVCINVSLSICLAQATSATRPTRFKSWQWLSIWALACLIPFVYSLLTFCCCWLFRNWLSRAGYQRWWQQRICNRCGRVCHFCLCLSVCISVYSARPTYCKLQNSDIKHKKIEKKYSSAKQSEKLLLTCNMRACVFVATRLVSCIQIITLTKWY